MCRPYQGCAQTIKPVRFVPTVPGKRSFLNASLRFARAIAHAHPKVANVVCCASLAYVGLVAGVRHD
jgi:hypothetical protein